MCSESCATAPLAILCRRFAVQPRDRVSRELQSLWVTYTSRRYAAVYTGFRLPCGVCSSRTPQLPAALPAAARRVLAYTLAKVEVCRDKSLDQCCTPTMIALARPRARLGGSVEVPAGRHGARVSWTIRRARAGLSSLATLAGHLESLRLESQRRRRSWWPSGRARPSPGRGGRGVHVLTGCVRETRLVSMSRHTFTLARV